MPGPGVRVLSAGTRVGVYEVEAPIGAGGMGEVYRARDTKLNRDVAVKILPSGFAMDPDRLARFRREAQIVASLNHPNIATIHGIEEIDGAPALIFELIDGQTLAELIAERRLPIDEALAIGRDVAEALQAAHQGGVVHRDLKPANIKVRADGSIKVLDFGLAKDLFARPAMSSVDSPTLTSPAVTGNGLILGTAAYMSPEQAKGHPVDKRADVWAFGCVLFEMLTGARPFDGGTVTETLAAVVRDEPDWSRLPAGVPRQLQTLLRRCLHKDPARRVADIAAAVFILRDVPEGLGVATPERTSLWRRREVFAAAAAAMVITMSGAAALWMMRAAPPLRVTRTLLGGATDSAYVAVSPDGTRVLYMEGGGADRKCFVRILDRLEPVRLHTCAMFGAFFSPDGKWLVFADGLPPARMLKRVEIGTGTVLPITPMTGGLQGGAWDTDDRIVFTDNGSGTGVGSPSRVLKRVSAAGGDAENLTTLENPASDRHQSPQWLPEGRGIIFTIARQTIATSDIAVLDLGTGMVSVVARGGTTPSYVAPGYLIYAAEDSLRAAPFDLQTLRTSGPAVPVVTDVSRGNTFADYAVAADGTLVYSTGGPSTSPAARRTLVWVDRTGREQPINAPERAYFIPRLSPDDTRIAVDIRDQENDVWILDLARETLTRLTTHQRNDSFPQWTPDGQHVVFSSNRDGAISNLYRQPANGAGGVERLTTSPMNHGAQAFTPDGSRLIVLEDTAGNRGLMLLDLKTGSLAPLFQAEFSERGAHLSPDGRWMSYESDESGRFEVYVRPFPNVDAGRWQVSTDGGMKAYFARTGNELFYVSAAGMMMSVPVGRGEGWNAGKAQPLFSVAPYLNEPGGGNGRMYNVSADGRRFLMIKPRVAAEQPAQERRPVVVLNWGEELRTVVSPQ
jgi:serine/threonine-protein kinase